MAQTLSKTGITTDGTITAAQITQSIDALTGVQAYDITLSGSFNMVSGSITGQPGVINNLTASYAIVALTEITKEVSSSFADLAANLTMEPSIVVTQITASGNISSSGVITGEGLIISDDASITDDLTVLGQIELGHASDTSLTRASAADVNIEGNIIYRAGGTDVPVTDGGTGVSTLTDGGVLLGSGTGAITAMAVLTDGQMIVGDGSTDPVAESGATLRTSIGIGTTDNVFFANISASGAISASSIIGTTISSSGDIIANNLTLSGDIISVGDDVTIIDDLVVGGDISGSGVIIGRMDSTTVRNLSDVNQNLTTNVCSNGLISVQQSANNDMNFTLPAPSAGLEVTFVAKITSVASEATRIAAPSAVLNGIAICDDGTEDIVGTTFVIAATKFIKGTKINCISDGTNWYITAFCLCTVGDVSSS